MDVGQNAFIANLATSLERKTNIALILGRIDHIGKIRDMYGLVSCDGALKTIDQILQKRFEGFSMRQGDTFFIIVTGEEAAKAAEIAESIRAQVENHEELVVPSVTAESVETLALCERVHITMHFGLTRASSHWTEANGLNELRQAAEDAICVGQRKLIANRVYGPAA